MAVEIPNNKMIILTAPSGAGKTTIVHHLLSTYDFIAFSISATTRPRRKNEVDGVDYHFISEDEFMRRIRDNEFVEWEEYAGHYYGTLKSEVHRIWAEGKVVIFDIEVRGATNIKQLYGEDCLAIFVSPPSIEVLLERLKTRGTESAESLRRRVNRVKLDMSYKNSFDEIIVNDVLDVAQKEAEIKVESFLFERTLTEEA